MQIGVQQHDGERQDVHRIFRGVPSLRTIDLEKAPGEGIEDPVEHLGFPGHSDVINEELAEGNERGEG